MRSLLLGKDAANFAQWQGGGKEAVEGCSLGTHVNSCGSHAAQTPRVSEKRTVSQTFISSYFGLLSATSGVHSLVTFVRRDVCWAPSVEDTVDAGGSTNQ